MIHLFTAIGFSPGGNGRKTCTKVGQRQLYTKAETIQKTIRKHRIHKIKKKDYLRIYLQKVLTQYQKYNHTDRTLLSNGVVPPAA